MKYIIEQVSSSKAENLCRLITANLPDYFGLPEANEHDASGVRTRINYSAKLEDHYIGLISIDFPYPNNCNIYWMAVLRQYQRQGVGHTLINNACHFAIKNGATTITVETLVPFEADESYLKTYRFYQSVGFSSLLNLKPQGYE